MTRPAGGCDLCRRLQAPTDGLEACDINPLGQPQLKWKSNFTQAEFEDVVNRSKEYIKAGDIFQVVLSQRLELETKASALEIYRALRVVNPSPFMFLLNTPHCELIGASPEIMVRVEEGRSRSGRWRERGRAAKTKRKTTRSPKSCWTIRRKWPSM